MSITDLASRYFAGTDDANRPGEWAPDTSGGNVVRPLIDGRAYFDDLRAVLNGLGSGPKISEQFFYLCNWYLHLAPGPGQASSESIIPGIPVPQTPTIHDTDTEPPFKLRNETTEKTLSDILVEKAAQGVDVRAMVWVNPGALTEPAFRKTADPAAPNFAANMYGVNLNNLLSINDLRNREIKSSKPGAPAVKPMSTATCMLTIAHLVGAIHVKAVVTYDGARARAYVGGIDFHQARATDPSHVHEWEYWHDAVVSIEGPAVESIYEFLRYLWNEQLSRAPQEFLLNGVRVKAVADGTKTVPARSIFAKTSADKHWVQVCRTLPQFHFKAPPEDVLFPFGTTPLKGYPQGRFEVIVARRKAVSGARTYIYIEDPEYRSQELMELLNSAVRNVPELKIILLYGTAVDPADPKKPALLDCPQVEAIKHLVGAGPNKLSAPQLGRIGLFFRRGRYVHSKTTIIDDNWLWIGSANISRRSLYTDAEVSVGVLDTENKLAKAVRVNLWAEHFGKTAAEKDKLSDLDKALGIWKRAWNLAAPFSLTDDAGLRKLIFEESPLTIGCGGGSFDAKSYDFGDPDSRKRMGVLEMIGKS